MKHNDETVKAVALAIKGAHDLYGCGWTEQAKAAIAAMPPQEVSVQEAVSAALIEASEHAKETAKSWRDNGFPQAALALFDEAKLLRALSEGKA